MEFVVEFKFCFVLFCFYREFPPRSNGGASSFYSYPLPPPPPRCQYTARSLNARPVPASPFSGMFRACEA